jgi:hypothetical protein
MSPSSIPLLDKTCMCGRGKFKRVKSPSSEWEALMCSACWIKVPEVGSRGCISETER